MFYTKYIHIFQQMVRYLNIYNIVITKINKIYNNLFEIFTLLTSMTVLIFLFFLFGSIRASVLPIPIYLDFHSIRAKYVRNSDIKLDFYCTPVTETCKVQFKNAPLSWKISENSLTMNQLEQKSLKVVRSWNLDISVTENKNNFYSLPVRITIENNQVIVEKVDSLIKEDKTSNIKRVSTKRILQNIGDPTRVIKVLATQNPVNSLPKGFGLPSDNNNPLLASLISTSNSPISNRQPQAQQPQPQPVTPQSLQFESRKQQALRNQVQANKKIQNLLASIKRLKQDLVRMKSQTQVTKKKTDQLRAISEKCGNDLFFYQNTIAKIQNAIIDRQNKIEQLRPASNKLQIEQQTKRLKQLEEEKTKIQWDSATNSSLLLSLQKQLDDCRNLQKQNSKVLSQAKNQLSKNQIDIQKLRSQVATTKTNLTKINSDLADVRSIISNLQQRLRDARQRQSNLVKQKATFEQTLSNSSNRLSSLEADSKSISLQTANLSDPNPCSREESKVRTTQNDIDEGKRLDAQNQISLSRQRSIVESVTKIVNPDNATLTLKNEIDLLKKQLSTFNDNYNKTSPICDANFQNYTQMAVLLNKNYSSIQQANETISGINDDLIEAQKSLDDAKISLAQILREQFTYLNRKGGNVILPTLPQINTTQTNSDFNTIQTVSNVSVAPVVPAAPAPSVNSTKNSSDNNRTPKLIISDPSVLNLLKNDEISQSPKPPSPPSLPSPPVSNQPISNPVIQSSPGITNNPTVRNNIQSNPTPVPSSNGDEFAITSKLGFKQVLSESLKKFLSSIGIQNIGSLTNNKYLYTLDDSTKKNLTYINSFTPITYSKFECTNPTTFDQGVVLEQIRPGVILLMNNKSKIQFRLNLGECTKIISTSPNNALKPGTTVFFSGVATVSIPGNMLLNAHSIICNPQQQ